MRDGKWAWKLNSFSVHAAPTIDLVYSNTVKNNSDYMGWIFGSNYVSGCQAVLQKQGAPSVVYFSNYMQYNGEGFLVVGFPTKGAQVGTYDVIVRNPDLGEVKKLGAFRITAP